MDEVPDVRCRQVAEVVARELRSLGLVVEAVQEWQRNESWSSPHIRNGPYVVVQARGLCDLFVCRDNSVRFGNILYCPYDQCSRDTLEFAFRAVNETLGGAFWAVLWQMELV